MRATPEERRARATEIGARIAAARDAAGYRNATRFAAAIGADRNSVGRWERGEVVPDALFLEAISRVVRVSADYLLRGETPPEWTSTIATWQATPTGSRASAEALAFVRSLPVAGYVPSLRFLDLALVAFEHGLTPTEAAAAARETEIAARPR